MPLFIKQLVLLSIVTLTIQNCGSAVVFLRMDNNQDTIKTLTLCFNDSYNSEASTHQQIFKHKKGCKWYWHNNMGYTMRMELGNVDSNNTWTIFDTKILKKQFVGDTCPSNTFNYNRMDLIKSDGTRTCFKGNLLDSLTIKYTSFYQTISYQLYQQQEEDYTPLPQYPPPQERYTQQPYNNTQPSQPQQPRRRICSSCNGTGISPFPSTGVCFGNTSDHYCEVCHRMVPCIHGPHGRCISCNGKGYILY
jgi:hypothetical protein